MIVFTVLFLVLTVSLCEFLLFRQRDQYQKNLILIEELNFKIGILKSLSYLLQSKNQTLEADWNQLVKILSAQHIYALPPLEQFLTSRTNKDGSFDKSADPTKNYLSSVDNIITLLIRKHELNKKLNPEQQKEALAIKW